MDKTIQFDRKCDWWNGRVLIDELKTYSDTRGMVSEAFRTDDVGSIESKMCYISETNPFVLRGPHEHESQKDSFISWKNRMIYQMYNKETNEMKWFVTDPTKITRVIVDIGIVHSYRNISIENVKTLNFPDKLFMGEDKKGYTSTAKIDEIRHEHLIKPTKTIWIFGADGRLGKAITNKLFNDIGYHNYHIIPIYEIIKNNKEGIETLDLILTNIEKEKNSIIINCIAKTDVQNDKDDFTFANFFIPKYLSEFSIKNGVKLVHFSTDYVYQQGQVSEYTKSKKLWENWFSEQLQPMFSTIGENSNIKDCIKIVRLANLFSENENDTLNALNKLFTRFKTGEIHSPKDLKIMPTDVNVFAEWFSKNYIHKLDEYKQYVNVSGKAYTFKELFKMSGIDGKIKVHILDNPEIINNPDIFINVPFYVELNCDIAIKRKFDTIRSSTK